ncbi:ribonuclease VapC [Bryocella elongata]|uniref:Ribonuclease VapC n=1 Tax=Bryocella elongata TaxID=863522 RepID=A0A1H5WY52_9BACT|nr:type II toxin-antitoxin system VapC family toxin [Bryocella elongata]SEG04434.1 ribonuclease VapC [Bryocella elongata]
MVIDTPVLIAIMRREDEAQAFLRMIADASPVSLSAASYFEACMVIAGSKDDGALQRLDVLIETSDIEIQPVTREDAELARDAFLRFGKGRHPAGLNFGDCFSYALAKRLNEPLLFKGDDFSKTDVQPT